MKVRASIKKRTPTTAKSLRRKGRLYVINKKNCRRVQAASGINFVTLQNPITLAGSRGPPAADASHGFFQAFSDINGWAYNITYFILIVAFTYFYTAITVRPAQMAEDMKRNNGFIPGVKPGKKDSGNTSTQSCRASPCVIDFPRHRGNHARLCAPLSE